MAPLHRWEKLMQESNNQLSGCRLGTGSATFPEPPGPANFSQGGGSLGWSRHEGRGCGIAGRSRGLTAVLLFCSPDNPGWGEDHGFAHPRRETLRAAPP